MRSKSFIQQRNDSLCALLALLNAKRFYGLSTPTYGDDEFEKLIDLANARHGTALCLDNVARYLGLWRIPLQRSDAAKCFPFTFGFWPPDLRSHCALAIGGTSSRWKVVNYYRKGPLVDWVDVGNIEFTPDCWSDEWNCTSQRCHHIIVSP